MLTLIITIGVVHFLALMTPGPDFLFVSQTAASRSRSDAMLGVLGIVTGVAFWAALTLLGLQFVFEKFIWLPRIIQLLGGIYLVFLGYLLLLGPSKRFSEYLKEKRLNRTLVQHKQRQKTTKLSSVRQKRYAQNIDIQNIDIQNIDIQNIDTQNIDGLNVPAYTKANDQSLDLQVTESRTSNTFLFGLLTNLSNPKVIIYFGSVFAPFLGNPERLGNLIKWELLILIIVETFIWFTIVALIFGLPKMQKIYQKYSVWLDALAGIFFAGFGSHLIFSLKITSFATIFTQ